MATNQVNVFDTTYRHVSSEGWEDLVAWDRLGGDLIDPLFQGSATLNDQGDCQNTENAFSDFLQHPASVASDYTSAPPSVTEGATSDYSFSLPNSLTSPTALATSPFWGRNDRVLTDSFNPFSPLEPGYSQAFDNVGLWVDPPVVIEPLQDHDHARGISIPPSLSRTTSNTFNTSPWLEVPPVLSSSPPESGSSRSISIPRSLPRNVPRTSSSSVNSASSSLTNYGFVQYQVNSKTNRLVPSNAGSNSGKRQRGRIKALSPEQRRNAALMRVIGACSNCKRRKEKCDPGIPCKACIEHYKTSLPQHPCRSRLLTSLTNVFLSQRLGWHPTSRPLTSFLGPYSYTILANTTHTIPLILGFGPSISLQVHPVNMSNPNALYHDHIIYSWPPGKGDSVSSHTHAVLPAVLTASATDRLRTDLDNHLSLLVNTWENFRSFPLYCSPLALLREIYILFKSLQPATSESGLLLQALKLLVLVHIGGDLTLSSEYYATSGLNTEAETQILPTPCFIRAALSPTVPVLASSLLHDVLERLERIALTRECNRWGVVVSTVIIVLMVVESVQYHAAKIPYHTAFDLDSVREARQRDQSKGREMDERGVDALLDFYKACFGECHKRLVSEVPLSNHGAGGRRSAVEERFEGALRAAVKKADEKGYLAEREKAEPKAADGLSRGQDMAAFFDRLVARLVLLKT